MRNLCAKRRPIEDPYEIWVEGTWEWRVLKKYQVDDGKPYARWLCFVRSPFCPNGEQGDCYVADVKRHGKKVFPVCSNREM